MQWWCEKYIKRKGNLVVAFIEGARSNSRARIWVRIEIRNERPLFMAV